MGLGSCDLCTNSPSFWMRAGKARGTACVVKLSIAALRIT